MTPLAQRLIRRTRELIEIRSVNPPGKEAFVNRWIARQMKNLPGVSCKPQQLAPNRSNLLVSTHWEAPARCLLVGHADVVPVPAEERPAWKSPPFQPELREGNLFGRGSSDMKGALACFMTALELVAQNRDSSPWDISILITADEEAGSAGMPRALQHFSLSPTLALIGEPTDLRLAIGQKGLAWIDIQLQAPSRHACQASPESNPLVAASHLAIQLSQATADFPDDPVLGAPTLTPTICKTDRTINTVSPQVTLSLDSRLTTNFGPSELETVLQEGRQALKQEFPTIETDRSFRQCRPAFQVSRPQWTDWLQEELSPPKLWGNPGFTEAWHVYHHLGIPSYIWGPGTKGHVRDESVAVEQLVRYTEKLVSLLTTLPPASFLKSSGAQEK